MATNDPPDDKSASQALVKAPAQTPTATDPALELEQRFLDFAYKTNAPINGAAVAYALKISIKDADHLLEDLAARDVLVRDIDEDAAVSFRLPGKGAGKAHISAPIGPKAMNGLLVNFILPGVGSLMNGKSGEGAAQLALLVIGAALLVTLHLIGIPILIAAWIWGVVTGIRGLSDKGAAS